MSQATPETCPKCNATLESADLPCSECGHSPVGYKRWFHACLNALRAVDSPPEPWQEVYPPLIFQERIREAEQQKWQLSLTHCLECGFRKGDGHALRCGRDFKPVRMIGEIGREEEWGIEFPLQSIGARQIDIHWPRRG